MPGERHNLERLLRAAYDLQHRPTKVPETRRREHHGREYLVAAASLVGEYLAIRYGIVWLAWLAALFFWLSVASYTKQYFHKHIWFKYGILIVVAAAIAVVTVVVTRQPKAETPVQSVAPIIPDKSRPYDLSEPAKRKNFLDQVNTSKIKSPDTLRIGCTDWSESSCVAAGTFLLLFSEAGWKTDSNRVFRVEPQIPSDGISLVTGGEIPRFARHLPPHLGFWKKADTSQVAISSAFKAMNIPVKFSTDGSLPLGTLGVYFGPEPQH